MPGPFVPTIDVLSGGFIADGRLCDAILEKILDYRLFKAHILCDLIYGEESGICLSALPGQPKHNTGYP